RGKPCVRLAGADMERLRGDVVLHVRRVRQGRTRVHPGRPERRALIWGTADYAREVDRSLAELELWNRRGKEPGEIVSHRGVGVEGPLDVDVGLERGRLQVARPRAAVDGGGVGDPTMHLHVHPATVLVVRDQDVTSSAARDFRALGVRPGTG